MNNKVLKIGIIGLDTSHTIEFTRLIQGTNIPEGQKIDGMHVVSCMRFPSPFHTESGQDERQKQMEDWGVRVSRSLDETIKDIDVVMIEINDPSQHLNYFEKVADIGKPIFLDKPFAGDIVSAKKIAEISKKKKTKVWSSSSLRFAPDIVDACNKLPQAILCNVFGPMGKASAGNSLIWYGVHTFEMLVKIMGNGAKSVFAIEDSKGIVSIVEYNDNRRAIAECNENIYLYGGRVQGTKEIQHFMVSGQRLYYDLLLKIKEFFYGLPEPVKLEETLEVMAIMDSSVKSLASGKSEIVDINF